MRRSINRSSSQRGASLFDLLMTMAAAAIVLVVSVPFVGGSLRAYQRNGATRKLLAEIRTAQSVAITRGDTFGLQWGGDANVDLPDSQYRIVRDTGGCSFPPVDSPLDDDDVIRDWHDIRTEFPNVTIQSIRDQGGKSLGGVMFDSLGASTNPCTGVDFPVTISVVDSVGTTRRIEIGSAGNARLL